jgi:hypothetical protein
VHYETVTRTARDDEDDVDTIIIMPRHVHNLNKPEDPLSKYVHAGPLQAPRKRRRSSSGSDRLRLRLTGKLRLKLSLKLSLSLRVVGEFSTPDIGVRRA